MNFDKFDDILIRIILLGLALCVLAVLAGMAFGLWKALIK